ncbi:MAG: sporulation membrane protein YtaF [Desulfobaccales bacterium]
MQVLHLGTIFLLALACSLDNIGIGIAYGVRRISIPFGTNLLIALLTAGGTLLVMLSGHLVTRLIHPQTAILLGGVIIILAGAWVVLQETVFRQPLRPPEELHMIALAGVPEVSLLKKIFMILDNPFIADRDFSGHIDLREGLILGLALLLNNLPIGLVAGLLGLSPLLISLSVISLSILTIWVGISTGYCLGTHWMGRLSGPISGLILIIIGAYEIWGA